MDQVELDALISELLAEADQAAWHIGFMNVVIDRGESIADRVDGSHSGYAALVAMSAVKAALVLYCARAWDTAKDAVSLRNVITHLPSLYGVMERRRIQLAEMGIEFDWTTIADRYVKAMEAYDAMDASAGHHHIRLLRTEYFAHRVIESRERDKLAKAGIVVEPATYDSLLKLAMSTVTLVGEIGYLWDRRSNPYHDRIARAEHCCREFWRNVPVLRDVEEWEDQVMAGSAMPDESP